VETIGSKRSYALTRCMPNNDDDDDDDAVSADINDVFQEILNRCFDDIEQFMIRLQSVSDAYKELEKRRKGHKKKGLQPGGNTLF